MPECNGKQNLNESHTNRYQKYNPCSYDYKLASVDDKFSNPFNSYLAEDAVYSLINSMTEESKYCGEVMKKHFNKELVMTEKDNEDFKNSNKFCICDNTYVDGDVKVRRHCHVTRKYRGSRHRDCNINVKLNHKIPMVFHNLVKCYSLLINQELDKFNLKLNVIPNGLEKCVL